MTKSRPAGWQTLTPRLVAKDARKLVAFLKAAFDASGDLSSDAPAVMRIGDSQVMVSSVGPRDEMRGFFYLYVDDADAIYRRALGAGAKSLEAPSDMPYGDRRAMIEDPCGNIWQIATYRGP